MFTFLTPGLTAHPIFFLQTAYSKKCLSVSPIRDHRHRDDFCFCW